MLGWQLVLTKLGFLPLCLPFPCSARFLLLNSGDREFSGGGGISSIICVYECEEL